MSVCVCVADDVYVLANALPLNYPLCDQFYLSPAFPGFLEGMHTVLSSPEWLADFSSV